MFTFVLSFLVLFCSCTERTVIDGKKFDFKNLIKKENENYNFTFDNETLYFNFNAPLNASDIRGCYRTENEFIALVADEKRGACFDTGRINNSDIHIIQKNQGIKFQYFAVRTKSSLIINFYCSKINEMNVSRDNQIYTVDWQHPQACVDGFHFTIAWIFNLAVIYLIVLICIIEFIGAIFRKACFNKRGIQVFPLYRQWASFFSCIFRGLKILVCPCVSQKNDDYLTFSEMI
ncbi:MAG: hypothetical protein EZS28_006623 [Streblomastix strix]|uniref:Intimal thickness related receptor IRP domain-containing protein n=1 Tax=Streblomastix strix TaxID=222440 RepID=A0A5J4WSG2_9EUKA|nr:MAG: hypothetical protein EZS28_006623 [Streblomastix strix]